MTVESHSFRNQATFPRPPAPRWCRPAALTFVLWGIVSMPGAARMTEPPVSFRQSVTPLEEILRHELPPLDVARLRAEDAAGKDAAHPGPVRFAGRIPVRLGLDNSGTWEELDDGGRLWRLVIVSPGALSLNLRFDRFELPDGGGLWLYDPRAARIEGPYTGRDRTPGGGLWTPILLGDEIVLEVHVPAGATGDAAVELGAVHHGYRSFGELPSKQGACNIDVVCPEADPYRDQVRSVARYTHSGLFLCTGQLVNNTALDFRPLFLTAQHCAVDAAVDSMVIYWGYEAPSCGQLSGGSLVDNQMGASLLASYGPSDFTLVELDQLPAVGSDVYYAGWDAGGSVPQSVVAIHHPEGDEKAIAIEGDPLDSTHITGFGEEGEENHWIVNAWDAGTTEPGSSGSCIFDQTSKRCLGTLTGGTAGCANLEGFDVFAKLSVGWTGGGTPGSRLADWLDPVGGGSTRQLDGADAGDDSACRGDGTTVCLGDRRFEVAVGWSAPPDFPGLRAAYASSRSTPDSALFYYFDPDNLEFVVKVFDGCAVNGHFWVFCAAATDVEFTITVTDTQSGEVKRYEKPLGGFGLTDFSAFATCP